MYNLLCSHNKDFFLILFCSHTSPERRRVSAGVRLRGPGADRSVEGRARQQRPLVRHAGGQPAAGPPHLGVHGRLCGPVGFHSDLSGGDPARGTAGPDPESHSEQDAASGDSECHAGKGSKAHL